MKSPSYLSQRTKEMWNPPAIAVIHLCTVHHDRDPSVGQTEIWEENFLHNTHVLFVLVCKKSTSAPQRLTALPHTQGLINQDRKMGTDVLSGPLAIESGVMLLN